MASISAERTLGQSPKVVWPGLASAGLGIGLILIGELVDSPRTRSLGLGALGAAAITAVLGYVAPPGAVLPPDHDVTDAHEHDTTHRVTRFERTPAGEPETTRPAS